MPLCSRLQFIFLLTLASWLTPAVVSGAVGLRHDDAGFTRGPIEVVIVPSAGELERANLVSEQHAREHVEADLLAQRTARAGELQAEAAAQQSRYSLVALIIAGLSVIVTAIGTYVLVGTLKVSAQSVEVAERTLRMTESLGKEQTRAYINISSAKLSYNESSVGRHFIPEIDVVVKNLGATPAKSILCRMKMALGPINAISDEIRASYAHEITLLKKGEPQPTQVGLGAGDTVALRPPVQDMRLISGELNDYFRNNQVRLFFHVTVTYTDVYGGTHHEHAYYLSEDHRASEATLSPRPAEVVVAQFERAGQL